MARPRKKKRSANQPSESNTVSTPSSTRPPKSLVIRIGASTLGPSLSTLTRDFRVLMSPNTASRLRERRANRLRDYTSMAGPLGVTHLFLFSRSKSGNVHLRIALTPRGPTLTLRVEGYVLSKDVTRNQKRPVVGMKGLYDRAPLMVMNNFASQSSSSAVEKKETKNQDPIEKQLESLTTTIFQGMFPAINPSATPLSSIRRVLLLNREPRKREDDGTWMLTLRHYAITTRPSGVSKRVKRFDPATQRRHEAKHKGTGSALPNLGKLEDAADYILGNGEEGYTSASETELDTDNEIEVLEAPTTRILNKKQQQKKQETDETNQERASRVEKKAVKLVELGPRMRLRLIKVEEGLCEGRVMWNEFVNKTQEQKTELEGRWKARREEKEERRKKQRENVERKRREREERKDKDNSQGGSEEEDDDDDDDDDDADFDAFSDLNDNEDGGEEADAGAGLNGDAIKVVDGDGVDWEDEEDQSDELADEDMEN